MRQPPRAEEEAELETSLVGISGVDVHDSTRVRVARVRNAAVSDELGDQLVEQRRLADANPESHRTNYRSTRFRDPETTV